jgi:hypothetical protein
MTERAQPRMAAAEPRQNTAGPEADGLETGNEPSSRPTRPAALTDLDDRELVELARAGDLAGFEALYERHKAPLFRTALAVTREAAPAEELLQEAFLRAYRHMARIELAPGASLRPWLHRITINLAYDWAAGRALGPGAPLPGAAGGTSRDRPGRG